MTEQPSFRSRLHAAGWVRDKSNIKDFEGTHPSAAEAIFGLLHRF
ncbi:MAG: hypothetical protein SOX97_06000 [Sutterella sp.]|nr:hypothetical protein [Sutterella sp.]